MRLTRVVPSIAAATAAALGLAACGSSSSTPSSTAASAGGATPASVNDAPPTSPVTLQEAGSSLLYPLFKIWAPAYHNQVPTVTIAPAAGGSGHGISGALSGTLDIGASDAYLPPAQMAAHKDVLNIPVAISAQMVNYNVPGASKHLKLNGAILQGIYEGKITNWNDPQIAKANPGAKLPNLKIVPLHRSDSSGDTFLFTQYLSKSNPNGWGKTYHFNTTWPGPTTHGSLTENGNGGMVTGCSHTPGCVAYIGISYKNKTDSAGLGEAMLQNQAGSYLSPTAS
ncbi:MAG TPA: phosphate ABC transporter substrate-binding protein PstS, partial [Acidimicrobiales bacterium]|nr:phosphate ABC transporter substrate-binding protein PstS [Acidimicrobiales bacterium]